ncbi:hypothetical protein A4A49_38628 [Nicotiana attenuata]|uniref:Uncharacterized protein n=1 Tax=Nicotiana attenuata TaxID=49451 RepID=A0A1J6K5G1_NICAT|nr:hypothetical protein A4A49_38628 [Nicotiana attenuata]
MLFSSGTIRFTAFSVKLSVLFTSGRDQKVQGEKKDEHFGPRSKRLKWFNILHSHQCQSHIVSAHKVL